MSDVTLDQILSGETSAEVKEEAPEVEEQSNDRPEEEPTGEKTTDSTPELEPEPSEQEAPKVEDIKESTVPLSAHRAERQKRQDLERRIQELEGQNQKDSPPDVFEDQEGFNAYIDQKIKAGTDEVKVIVSQALMRNNYADYDEKEALFLEMAQENPELLKQLQDSPVPAEFAYKTALKHERFKQFDNFDDALNQAVTKEKAILEKQIREQVEKEIKSKQEKFSNLPPSGAKGSSLSDDFSLYKEPSLKDILGK